MCGMVKPLRVEFGPTHRRSVCFPPDPLVWSRPNTEIRKLVSRDAIAKIAEGRLINMKAGCSPTR